MPVHEIEKCSIRGFYAEVELCCCLFLLLRSIVPWIKSYGTNPISGEVNSKHKYVERIIEQKCCVENVTNHIFFQFHSKASFFFLSQKLEAKSLTKLNYAKNNEGNLVHCNYNYID